MLDARLGDDIERVVDLLNLIKKKRYKGIDNKILHCIVQLIYRCGLMRKEVPITKIGDIHYQGNKMQDLIPGSFGNPNLPSENAIPLDSNVTGILNQYIQYLSSSDTYNSSPSATLFPKYEGKDGDKILFRDLKKYFQIAPIDNITEISSIGIKNYHRDLLNRGFNETESLKKTAKQFRKKENTIKEKVKGIKPSKKLSNFDKLLIHWDKMLFLDFSNQNTVENYKQRGLKFITGIKCKNPIKLEITTVFLNALKEQKKVFTRSPQQKTLKKHHTSSMKKLIKLIKEAKIEYDRSESPEASKIIEAYFFGEDETK